MNDFSNIYEDAKRAMDGRLATDMPATGAAPQVISTTVQIPGSTKLVSSDVTANVDTSNVSESVQAANASGAYMDAHSAASEGVAETRISILLPTTAYFMSGVRDFTMTIVQNMTGFPEKWAFRFQSIVDELCNNAIEHGSAPGQEVKVTFISRAGESIYVSVEDTGTGPDKTTAEGMYTIVNKNKAQLASNTYSGIRGRGLAQIVSQWTDELKFDNINGGGLKVSVIKRLDPSEIKTDSHINSLKLQ